VPTVSVADEWLACDHVTSTLSVGSVSEPKLTTRAVKLKIWCDVRCAREGRLVANLEKKSFFWAPPSGTRFIAEEKLLRLRTFFFGKLSATVCTLARQFSAQRVTQLLLASALDG